MGLKKFAPNVSLSKATFSGLTLSVVGLSAVVFSSVSPSAQAANLVQNGGFVPTPFGDPSSIINKPSGVTIPGWTVTDTASSNLTYVVSDGTIATTGPSGTTHSGLNSAYNSGRKNWTLWTAGQTINSQPDAAGNPASGWYIASDGDPGFSGYISQTISGLTPGAQYTVSFSQSASQFDTSYNSNGSIIDGPGYYIGNTTDYWKVSFGGSTQNSTLMSHTHGTPTLPWTQQSLTFIANSATQILTFAAQGTPGAEPPVALLSGVSVTPVSITVPEPLNVLGAATGLALFGSIYKYSQKKKS